jgi:hypothetical protein
MLPPTAEFLVFTMIVSSYSKYVLSINFPNCLGLGLYISFFIYSIAVILLRRASPRLILTLGGLSLLEGSFNKGMLIFGFTICF